MKYKEYTGHVEYDDEAGILHGEVLDLRDVITFQGTSVEEVEQSFRESIDDYLEFCQQRGEKPDKPFAGRLTLRRREQACPSVMVSELCEEEGV